MKRMGKKVTSKEKLLAKYSEGIKVGPHGFVRLVDTMGGDDAIVQAARTSYGKGTKAVSEDRGLVRYLMRHRHTTPFEMCEIKIHIKIPMDSWRQMIRHRTASVNEYSTRYSIAIEDRCTTTPGEWRLQSTNNKQGSSGLVTDSNSLPMPGITVYADENGCRDQLEAGNKVASALSEEESRALGTSEAAYYNMLQSGVAKEQARKILPLSTYTMAYWKIDLHNLFHFLSLRLDSHAQQEIREFAEAIWTIVQDWVPHAAEAFQDYRLDGMFLTGAEAKLVKQFLTNGMGIKSWPDENRYEAQTLSDLHSCGALKDLFDHHGVETKRERADFLRKMGVI